MSDIRGEDYGLPRNVEIAPLDEADLDQVMEIEEVSFPTPWPRKAFIDEFSTEWSHLYAAKDTRRDRLLGYCNYWVVQEDAHLLNLAVAPAARRKGVASALLRFAMDHAHRLGARYIHLEVRRNNEPAKALYKSMGFKMIGVRKRYYAREGEDALVFKKALAGSTRRPG